MIIRILILSLLAARSTFADLLIPGEDLSVTVYTHGDIFECDEDFEMNVRLHATRNLLAKPQITTSIETTCKGFDHRSDSLNPAELDALFAAGEAADKREEFQQTVVTDDLKTEIKVVKINQSRKILILRNHEKVGVSQGEVRKVRQALIEAKAGEEWFKKLLVAEKVPDPTPEARPPRATNYVLTLPIGFVSCRGFGHEVQIQNWARSDRRYDIVHALWLFDDVGTPIRKSSGPWVADLLNEASTALKAVEAGRNFKFISPPDPHVRFSVSANLVTKEADVSWSAGRFLPNGVQKGHYSNANHKEIRALIESCHARIKWHKANESLFFARDD